MGGLGELGELGGLAGGILLDPTGSCQDHTGSYRILQDPTGDYWGLLETMRYRPALW